MTITKLFTVLWTSNGSKLSIREIYKLYEIFGPFPIVDQYTLRDGMIGLGKSRIIVANQDQLSNALSGYINNLTDAAAQEVKTYIAEWDTVSTKVVKFKKAEGVEFRTTAPEEQRKLIRQRIQNYIPIFQKDEVDPIMGNPSGNEIWRG